MAKNPQENITIVLFCFDVWKQTCVILLPVGCSHDVTNLQHKRACQRTNELFCVGDRSRRNRTYGALLFLSDWTIITDSIASIMMISWRYHQQKIVNEYSLNINIYIYIISCIARIELMKAFFACVIIKCNKFLIKYFVYHYKPQRSFVLTHNM